MKAKILCIILVMLDIFINLATAGTSVRFSRILRSFFAIDRFRNIRKIVVAVASATPMVLIATIVILTHCSIFAFVGHTIFNSEYSFPSIACNSNVSYVYQVLYFSLAIKIIIFSFSYINLYVN